MAVPEGREQSRLKSRLVRDVVATESRVQLLDLFRSGRHLLLLFTAELPGEDVVAHLDVIAAAIRERHGESIDAFVVAPSPLDESAPRSLRAPTTFARRLGDPSGLLHLAVGAGAPTILLVRPDGHLGYRGQPADPEPLRAHLDEIFVSRR